MLGPSIKLAWQLFHQEKYANHQVLLRWTQGVLLVFMVTLSLTSSNIQYFLERNLQSLLGADVVVSHSQKLTLNQIKELNSWAKKIVWTRQLKAMITRDEQWQQISLKAVGNDYPLQGELRYSQQLDVEGEARTVSFPNGIPRLGEIWLEPRLMKALNVHVGEDIELGERAFKVSSILLHEPDRLLEAHNVDMRAMINAEDLSSLQFPDEVIQHRYLIAANNSNIQNILDWQAVNLPAARIHHKGSGHPLALFWKRVENFVGLTSIILFFMAAIGIQQLSHVHVRKDQLFTALCMSMTASKLPGAVISWFKWFFGFAWSLPGVLLFSTALHWLIVKWLRDTFTDIEWFWDVTQLYTPIAILAVVFMLFYSRVWLSFINCSAAQLLREAPLKSQQWISQLMILVGLTMVAFFYSDNHTLTFMVVIALAFCVVTMIVVSWGSLYVLERITRRMSGLIPFSLYMMRQRIVSKSTQMLGVGLSCFLLLFTLMLLKDFGASMSHYTRQHDGNVLVTQATPAQMDAIQQWAGQKDISLRQHKPYVYAQLLEVNSIALAKFISNPSESAATLSRPIRLHWSDTIPGNNRVVTGQWWQPDTRHWQQISVEQEVMTDLKLHLGDTLYFQIGPDRAAFRIVASHEYQAGNGSITFWMQVPPAALAHLNAARYSMASMELAEPHWAELSQLWRQHPSLRMVTLKDLMRRYDNVLGMVTTVVSGFSLIISLLAAIVIVATVKSCEARDRSRNSVILSFGLSRLTCFRLTIIEWFFTATIAACGAISGTYLAGMLIYHSQFSLAYSPDFLWLAATLCIVLLLVTALGLMASKQSLNNSIRQLMAEN
ncbi:permease [Alteromonas ponticola]|uniref:Permease n=1 Tax=Alteromonas aquimaris TaxID=2998417 RepID=A0ABT3P8A8_9ALTE|nr:FtsX-like permease family protein [Alteromonas aquimaris]MCW8109013.1 permease [Alteromonas aquimaris]